MREMTRYFFSLIFKEYQTIIVHQPMTDERDNITKIRFEVPEEQKDNF